MNSQNISQIFKIQTNDFEISKSDFVISDKTETNLIYHNSTHILIKNIRCNCKQCGQTGQQSDQGLHCLFRPICPKTWAHGIIRYLSVRVCLSIGVCLSVYRCLSAYRCLCVYRCLSISVCLSVYRCLSVSL